MNNSNFTEEQYLELANRYIAGGVVSLNRKVSPVRVFQRAEGSRIWDIQGREYIDYHGAFSPFVLGHNDPSVNAAVQAAMQDRLSLIGSGPTPWEIELSQAICESVASVDQVQLTNTGSEATSAAIRLSRAYTGRQDIVVMLGGYNGWQNDVARSVNPTLDELGGRRQPGTYPFLPGSQGIPESVREHVHVVNFNDLDAVSDVMKRHPIACVITEPVLQNIGVVHPEPGFLQGLIDLCDENGALCVFDEVKTGFRTALEGYQGKHGLSPHLSAFGKAVANGYPMGIIGGRKEIMSLFANADVSRRVFIAGTYSAHPLACVAALETIRQLRGGEVYPSIRSRCEQLYRGLEELFREKGVTFHLAENASAFCVYFADRAPRDWLDILDSHDFEFDMKYRHALIEEGIYHIPIACKQGSVSFAHSEADIDRTLERTRAALGRI